MIKWIRFSKKFSLDEQKQEKYRPFIILSGILLVGLISALDYLTKDYVILIFYIVPVVFVTWLAGRNASFFLALVSTIAVFILDVIETPRASSFLVHFWNAGMYFVIFGVIIYFLLILKRAIVQLIAEKEKVDQYAKDLEKAMQIKSDFTSMVSHELRTPLVAIKEGINVILEGLTGQVNDEQRDVLSMVKRSADRLNRLVCNVLDFQKLESIKVQFEMKDNDINEVVTDLSKSMGLVAKNKGLSFDLELGKDLPVVKFDRDEMIQVLTNLASNAIKFTPSGGVKIKTFKTGNVIQVSVADTGYGIKDEDIPKLFQSFQRLDSAKMQRIEGTGLGLAICKEIIKQHNGKIWVESEFGKGTVFHFILPIEEHRR